MFVDEDISYNSALRTFANKCTANRYANRRFLENLISINYYNSIIYRI